MDFKYSVRGLRPDLDQYFRDRFEEVAEVSGFSVTYDNDAPEMFWVFIGYNDLLIENNWVSKRIFEKEEGMDTAEARKAFLQEKGEDYTSYSYDDGITYFLNGSLVYRRTYIKDARFVDMTRLEEYFDFWIHALLNRRGLPPLHKIVDTALELAVEGTDADMKGQELATEATFLGGSQYRSITPDDIEFLKCSYRRK